MKKLLHIIMITLILSINLYANDNIILRLTSNSFQNGKIIPVKYTCKGINISPEFEWTDAPAGTTSFALIMDDEDAPCSTGNNACVHWALFNIPGYINIIHENMNTSILNGLTQGKNYTGTTGYEGPCPPNTHNYKITIFALNHNMPVISNGVKYTRSSFRTKFSKYILGEATYTGKFSP